MELWDLKVQLTNEFLRNGGMEDIKDVQLLNDIINYSFFDESTYTACLTDFMDAVLVMNRTPPFLSAHKMAEYDSFVQKDLFFAQVKIDAENQINELFDCYLSSNDYIFRGQREASWRLYSTIQRLWVLNECEGRFDFGNVLRRLVEVGKQNFKENIGKIVGENHIDVVNDLAVLGFLQHHGCPTPLLDWTFSFANALFFAVDGVEMNTLTKEIKDYVSVYFLHRRDIQPGGIRCTLDRIVTEVRGLKPELITAKCQNRSQRRRMERRFKNRSFLDRRRLPGLTSHVCTIDHLLSYPDKVLYADEGETINGIVFFLLNNNNIKVQKGTFVFNATPFLPLEQVAFDVHGKDGYKFCACYNINKSLVPFIKNKLNELGISKEYLYPDGGGDVNASDIFSTVISI